ncbi:MAG: DUF87 domain-containing protein [Pseudomonadota bacterium]
MRKRHRIALFLTTLIALMAIFYLWQGAMVPSSSTGTVIFTSLIMISFVALFVEHWFTKPTDVLAASTSILLVLAPLRQELEGLGIWYVIFFCYNLLMAAAALVALLLLDNEKSTASPQNRVSNYLRGFATTFGNGRLLYFALFILTMLFYVDSQSTFFIILFVYSAIILLADPKRFFLGLFKREQSHSSDIGEIFGVQSKNTFLVKLYKERKPVRRFDFVEFRYSMDESGKVRKGLIFDNYLLNREQWIKVLTTPDIANSVGEEPSHDAIQDNVVYKVTPEDAEDLLDRFVGVAVEKSSILKLRFQYGSRVPVAEGTLLEIPIGEERVLYQIVQGTTNIELLESKNEAGLVIGEAVQLGIWNNETLSFDRFGWVPEVNSPVYLARRTAPVVPPPDELLVGQIPETNFPILLNKKEAISHHLAILGVTGSGKSVFARDLIRRFAQDGTKVICVDFTNEYGQRFADLNVASIIESNQAEILFRAIDSISEEMAKFANQRDQRVIDENEETLKNQFQIDIETFLNSEDPISIFELPDVSNTTGILDYTRWFFRTLFHIAKTENDFGHQVCVVLEEAHTVVPEWNFIGSDDRGAQALVNSIGQIALQGRKYGIGFMVIAQRTANVSKTILTQCNSIVAFQQFDKTSTDFLTNYMGSDMVAALPMLRPRQAIAVGKAFRSGSPSIFQVPDIEEPAAN